MCKYAKWVTGGDGLVTGMGSYPSPIATDGSNAKGDGCDGSFEVGPSTRARTGATTMRQKPVTPVTRQHSATVNQGDGSDAGPSTTQHHPSPRHFRDGAVATPKSFTTPSLRPGPENRRHPGDVVSTHTSGHSTYIASCSTAYRALTCHSVQGRRSAASRSPSLTHVRYVSVDHHEDHGAEVCPTAGRTPLRPAELAPRACTTTPAPAFETIRQTMARTEAGR